MNALLASGSPTPVDAFQPIGPRAAGCTAQGARMRHGPFAPTGWGRGRTAEQSASSPAPETYARSRT